MNRQNRTTPFHQRFQSLLWETGQTDRDVAKLLGTTSTAVCHWRHGQTRPNIEWLARICKVFHVSADWLLGLSDRADGEMQ